MTGRGAKALFVLSIGAAAWCGAGCKRARCGDGAVDPGEDCDGTALGVGSCLSEAGLASGALACTAACSYDLSGCFACDNGVREAAESCDLANLGGETCASLGHPAGGTLACAADCLSFDESSCLDTDPPTVPVPRLPMNGDYVGSVHLPGSLRPAFAWEASTAPAGAPAIVYELETATTAAFDASATTSTTPDTTFTPAADLAVSATAPVGARYWWHVRACAGTACSAYSPGWYVNVGRARRDLNADGYDDLAITHNGGTTNIRFGPGPGAFTGGAAAQLSTVAIGLGRVAFGDVNGDGYADLLLTSDGPAEDGRVFFGGAGTTLDDTPDVTFAGIAGRGLTLADLNGDGFADIVLGDYTDSTAGAGAGAVEVWFGGPGAVGPAPDLTLYGALYERFGFALASGDVNGDGYEDLVVGALGQIPGSGPPGYGAVYLGGAGTALSTAPAATLAGFATATNDEVTALAVADVDGDGFGDVLVGSRDGAAAALYRGGAGASFDPAPDGIHAGVASTTYGFDVSEAGDLNGDGFGDIVIGALSDDSAGTDAGAAFVYLGRAPFDLVGPPDATVEGATANAALGEAVQGVGDVNGDGFDDLAIGSPGFNGAGSDRGRVGLYFGGAGTSFDTTEDLSLVGADFESIGIVLGRAAAAPQDAPGPALLPGRRRRLSLPSGTPARSRRTCSSRP